jgi:hypothetical protein
VHRIYRKEYVMLAKPTPGILVRILFSMLVAVTADAQEARNMDLDACLAEIKELRADINLLNLINGMHFTEAQLKGILKEARRLEEDLGPAIEADRKSPQELDEELTLLKEVRDRLQRNHEVSNTLKARYDVMEQRRNIARNSWKKRPKTVERVEESARRVHDLMSPAQREILSTYKACLIPPRDLKDPVRVGQAGNTGPSLRFLEIVRNMPEPVYARSLDGIVEKAIELLEHNYGAFKGDEGIAFAARMKKIIHRSRRMSDVEFQLNKDDLAAQLEPVDQAQEIKDALGDMGVERYQIQGMIIEFLLTPRIIPIIERRLKRRKESARQTGEPRPGGQR